MRHAGVYIGKCMDKVIHRSGSRGYSDNGWLKTYYTFSCANYYDPRRINFGALRVLNDDTIEGGEGLKSHPHDNMEIVFIPLEGSIDHGDSLGNFVTVSPGEAQIMSSGTGMFHNEYNHSADKPVKYVQMWIFPREYEVMPSYSHVKLADAGRNNWQAVVSPEGGEHVLPINQHAWVYMADMDAGHVMTHLLHNEDNGVYVFVLAGEVFIDGNVLQQRDAIGLPFMRTVDVEAREDSKILLIEVPMRKWSSTKDL